MTAEGLKALYETELRYHVGNPRLAPEERQGLWKLFSASRRMPPGELREQDHEGLWLWSDLHLGHAMTISVFGRPYSTPEEMDDALYGVWRRLVDPADTVVILGDVATRYRPRSLAAVRRLAALLVRDARVPGGPRPSS